MQKEQQFGKVVWQEDIRIEVDEFKGFFRKDDINREEVTFLLNKGYVLSSHVPLVGGRREDYLLKLTGNQSAGHFFLVRMIAEYIESLGGKPRISDSFSADVRFVSERRKNVAIEVETGVTFDKRKDLLVKKVEALNRWYDDWFFVVSEASYAEKYSRFGKTFTRTNVCRKLRSYFNKWNQKTRSFSLAKGRKRALPALKVKGLKKVNDW